MILELSDTNDVLELDISTLLKDFSDSKLTNLLEADWDRQMRKDLTTEAVAAGITDPQSTDFDASAQDLLDRHVGESEESSALCSVIPYPNLETYILEQRPALADNLGIEGPELI